MKLSLVRALYFIRIVFARYIIAELVDAVTKAIWAKQSAEQWEAGVLEMDQVREFAETAIETIERLTALRSLRVSEDLRQSSDNVSELDSRASPTPDPCRLREALVEARTMLIQLAPYAYDLSRHCSEPEKSKATALYKAAHELSTKIDSALSASPAEPEEATEAITAAMIKAGMDACQTRTIPGNLAAIYRAMRSAAPIGGK